LTAGWRGRWPWTPPALARLRAQGYRVFTQQIPAAITPKNRLLLAEPA
jgi:hypothetical protein